MNSSTMLDEVYNMIANAHYKLFNIWCTQIVFSWRWWLGVALCILPWIVWAKIRDKKDTIRLLFVGVVVMLVTATLDNMGLSYHLWHYAWQVIPFSTMFVPWDFTIFPVGIMIMLQFNTKINVYIKTVTFAFFAAFIFEPFFLWIGMYQLVYWKHYYSFIIYVPLYLFFNYIYKNISIGIHSNT